MCGDPAACCFGFMSVADWFSGVFGLKGVWLVGAFHQCFISPQIDSFDMLCFSVSFNGLLLPNVHNDYDYCYVFIPKCSAGQIPGPRVLPGWLSADFESQTKNLSAVG